MVELGNTAAATTKKGRLADYFTVIGLNQNIEAISSDCKTKNQLYCAYRESNNKKM